MRLARGVAAFVLLALLAAWGLTCALREPDGASGPRSAGVAKRPRAPRAPRPVVEVDEQSPAAPAAAESPRTVPVAVEAPERGKEPDPTVALRFRIFAADGRPAAGAHVAVYEDPDARPGGGDADAKGEITVQVRRGLAFVAVHAWNDTDGIVVTTRATADELGAPVELRLLPGERVAGRVLDERGIAVSTAVLRLALPLDFSGRIVRPMRASGARGPESRAVVACRATDDGTFVFPTVPHEADTRLLADAPGFGAFDADLAALPIEHGRVRVDLQSQALVRGRVKGPRGATVTDFRVRIGGRTAPAVLDAEGTFTATGAPRQGGWIVILPNAATGLGPCEVRLPATRTAAIDIGEVQLAAAHTIEGSVVWPDGRAVEGGIVEVKSRTFADGRAEATIALDGTFRIADAGEASYVLRVASAERALDPAPRVANVTKIRASHAGLPWRPGDGFVRITLDAVPILVLHSVNEDGADVPFGDDVRIDGDTSWWPDAPPSPVIDGARAAVPARGRPPWRFRITDASHAATYVEFPGGWPVVEQTVVLQPRLGR